MNKSSNIKIYFFFNTFIGIHKLYFNIKKNLLLPKKKK